MQTKKNDDSKSEEENELKSSNQFDEDRQGEVEQPRSEKTKKERRKKIVFCVTLYFLFFHRKIP